ncbi:MAG: hypothetical protein NTZ33_12325, partial [Bacteroidetes bacterium]|nr:hypothetical protein [Bacteroidota bacterium]
MKSIYIFIIICLLNINLKAQTFTNYTLSNTGVSINWASVLTIDKFGNLWIGSPNYLVKYNGSTWTSWCLNISASVQDINSIAIDNQNNKWIGT